MTQRQAGNLRAGRAPNIGRGSIPGCVLLVALFAILPAIRAADIAIPAPPELPVSSYILLDHRSGAVLAESNADQRVEPASLTKIMTVYSVADALQKRLIKREDQTIVSEHAWKQEGSRMFIEVNTPVTVDELLHGDIIQSGNDASVALAEHVSGSEDVFASVMNQHAARLGMKGSHFANSTGLPHTETYTTARDLSVLARALIHDFPDVYALFSIPEYTYNGIKQHNRNGLLGKDPSVDGIKTGYTEAAGYCLVASAERDGMRLISVVMGAKSPGARVQASQALLNYGYRFFETPRLYAASEKVTAHKVWKGDGDTVDLGAPKDVYVTIPRGKRAGLSAVAEVKGPLIAPIAGGQELGTLNVTLDGAPLATIPLVAVTAVGEGSLVDRVIDEILMRFE